MTTSPPTETRTAFEAWFAGHRFMHRYSLQKERDGTYQWHQVQIAWEAWQAAPSPEPAEQRLNKAARRIVDGAVSLRDHLTSCDKTMGATHACTCGMWAYARLLQELDSPETKVEKS